MFGTRVVLGAKGNGLTGQLKSEARHKHSRVILASEWVRPL